MASLNPGTKKDGTGGSKKTPSPNQLPPFARGPVKIAAPRTGGGRKSL